MQKQFFMMAKTVDSGTQLSWYESLSPTYLGELLKFLVPQFLV